MTTLKVTQIGNSLGVILTKAIAGRLKLQKGDALTCTETPNGIEISIYDADFEAKMKAARKVSKKYRNALRELAK